MGCARCVSFRLHGSLRSVAGQRGADVLLLVRGQQRDAQRVLLDRLRDLLLVRRDAPGLAELLVQLGLEEDLQRALADPTGRQRLGGLALRLRALEVGRAQRGGDVVDLGVGDALRTHHGRGTGVHRPAPGHDHDRGGQRRQPGRPPPATCNAHDFSLVCCQPACGRSMTASITSRAHASSSSSRMGGPPTVRGVGRVTRIVRTAGLTMLRG